MTKLFVGKTADDVWRSATEEMLYGTDYIKQQSRLGPVREYLHCSLHVSCPTQRWVVSRRPAMNPAFAIAELIWLLQGRRDSEFPNYWNPLLPRFAGRGEVYHGAYGHRLRNHFGFDQLERAYQILRRNPDSRQVVLQIWDSGNDMPHQDGVARDDDIPCNVVAMPTIRAGKLEWLQVMRSSDLFLGTPHNFVQFTSLQEIMAGWLGVETGSFSLVTDSAHIYEHDVGKLSVLAIAPSAYNTDSLALAKQTFDRILVVVGHTLDDLRAEQLSKVRFNCLIQAEDIPTGWHNLVLIAAADAARRRGWSNEAQEARSRCTNPALKVSWDAWLERCLNLKP